MQTKTVYMVARNNEMSLPIYVGSLKQCCIYVNKRSFKKIANEQQILKQFNDIEKEIEVNSRYIIIQTEVEEKERGAIGN